MKKGNEVNIDCVQDNSDPSALSGKVNNHVSE